MFFSLINFFYKLVPGRGFSHCMFFLVYKLFLQAGTAYYKVLIKQRNLNVNRRSVNIAMWCIRGDHIGDYIFIGRRLIRHRRLYT